MWILARDSGGLDLNSPYAYLLAGHHFAETSVVAQGPSGDIVGYVLAYRPPSDLQTVFVWQVTVHPSQRGSGIAQQMLNRVLDRAAALGATTMTATVTPSNDASRRLFTSVATARGAQIAERPCFGADLFPEGHEPEHELVIGPIDTDQNTVPQNTVPQTTNRKDLP